MSELEKSNHGSISEHERAPPMNRAVTPGGHPLDTSQPAFPVYHRKFGDPGPLGLFMFALTTFMLSWYNTGVRGITHPNVVVGMTLAVGGLGQFLSGMWNFASGNTFAATVFSSYGTFWISFGIIYLPGSGILSVAWAPGELESALGIYLMTWWLMTVIVLLSTLKSSLELFLTILFLKFTFLILAIGQLQQSLTCQKVGGGLGIVTSLLAMYTGASGILTPETSYFVLPTYSLAALAERRARKADPRSAA